MEVTNRYVTVDDLRKEAGHLTLALLEAEYELGNLGVACVWPNGEGA